ncbi:hypothetical protein LOK49_LG12G01707 [Camellia lanceoleosa]|uniref:Uncharacterized protein n=1 Tax=Camellia lanceoleosa TaxID=1840588 RepID=A0ACC0FT15_9ERIC|nr:hypothetical protein LOK49_LG12G01707 [Camellia lanceoleosa]
MTTLEDTDEAPAAYDVADLEATAIATAATAVSGGGETELTSNFQVDPAYTTPKQLQEEQDEAAGKVNKDRIQSLKSAVIISGVVVAIIGAICAVAKKVKEARH